MQVHRDEIQRIYERAAAIPQWTIDNLRILPILGRELDIHFWTDGICMLAYADATFPSSIVDGPRMSTLYATLCPQVGRVRLYYFDFDLTANTYVPVFLPIDGMP